ncbi:MAG TPA: hypothetical protein VH186_10405 [Chloroflexia bacterium]|nr:hypothetical protein [Chloroflexia bacterium]
MGNKLFAHGFRGVRASSPVFISSTRGRAFLLLVMLLSSMLLAACGQESTPVPPTPTPAPRFQQENNSDLFFTMNIPFNWNKNVLDANTVVYTPPDNANLGIGVVSQQIGKLTPDSRRLLEQRVDQLKSRFSDLKQDVGGGGTLTLVDTAISVDRLTYSSNNIELNQYITEANNVQADRAYVLFGVTPSKDADTYRPLYFDCFKSFSSTANPVPAQNNESGVADPTVVAANLGGKIRPTSGNEEKGKVLRLVEWETPPLNANLKTPRIKGLFPYDFGWRLRPYPTPTTPAIYLDSPVVDRTTNQAVMQISVFKDAFPSGNPTEDDWKKFYTPLLNTLFNQTITSYGSPFNVKIGDVASSGPLYRAPFVAISNTGELNSRGFVLFSRSGTHGVVSVLSLSPVASLKQDLVDGFDADFQRMVNSFSVSFNG